MLHHDRYWEHKHLTQFKRITIHINIGMSE